MANKLGLSMICKNESHVILRLLNSVAPIIDYWCIVDTGSTDGTQDIIRKFFDEQKIPGELLEIEWKDDFSYARNIALEGVEPHVDYGFWVDCDEELIIGQNFNKNSIFDGNWDSISLRTEYGKVDYTRKNIWKTKNSFRWEGPIHELLSSVNERSGTVLDNIHVVVRAEGSSWKNIKEKYLAHAKILEKYTETTADTRWLFYTAQSYRDASEYETSIEWYKKRASVNAGFIEEIFVSRFMIAKLSEAIGKSKTECTILYQEAHSADPVRGESIKGLIQMYQRMQDWENAYIFSLYGIRYNKNNPYPHRILFLDKNLYEYEMLELHSLSCYYTNRLEEGARCYWAMRYQIEQHGTGYLSEEQMKKIINNEQYFPKQEQLIRQLESSAKMKNSGNMNAAPRKGGSKYTPSKKRR